MNLAIDCPLTLAADDSRKFLCTRHGWSCPFFVAEGNSMEILKKEHDQWVEAHGEKFKIDRLRPGR